MAWWYSQDEDRWNGPCSDREEAISEGRDNYNGEGFMVMEADTGDYDMTLDSAHILEKLADQNEDRGDPDGDAPLYQVTPTQSADLEAMVSSAIKRWVSKHRIDIRAWCFKTQGKPESIPEDTTEYDEPPLLNRQA